MTAAKVHRDALATLLAEGVTDVEALAEHFDVVPRTIERALVRHGFRKPREVRHLTQQDITRIRQLREAGLPTRWIAEDVGCDAQRVIEVAGPKPDRQEFARVWQQIRRNPTLVALHRQFTPRRQVS